VKYYDVKSINDMIFTEGNVQASPQHIEQLNNQPPVPYKPPHLDQLPSTGYQVFLTGYAAHVLSTERKHAQFAMLNNRINQLRSIPRPTEDGFKRIGSVDTWKDDKGSHTLYFKVNNGQVLLFNIVPNKSTQMARVKQESPALYRVTRIADGEWQREKVNSVNTEYAAVNGMNNDLTKATWLMGHHLVKEFGQNNVKEFTLFHNPSIGGGGDLWESIRDKIGFTTKVTRRFSGVLQETQQNGKEVKWVAHSQGGLIFAEAVRYYLNGNSSTALLGGFNGVFKNKDKISLNKHSVSFHGNANNNYRSSFLFERAGIKVISVVGGKYDLVYVVAGLNSFNPKRLAGSVIYSNHVFGGSVQQSPHTTTQGHDEWKNNMSNGPGKGRNALQRGFDSVAGEKNDTKFIPNHQK
jgi:hypothetical protein